VGCPSSRRAVREITVRIADDIYYYFIKFSSTKTNVFIGFHRVDRGNAPHFAMFRQAFIENIFFRRG